MISAPDGISVEDLDVPSDTDGIVLRLRHKWRRDAAPFTAARTVVLVHGATYSSGSLFDVPFEGVSLLDHLALAGLDVFALDVRGYGGSTRPPEMGMPAAGASPIGRTETGVRDLASAVAFVRRSRGLGKVSVFGMSWGGTVAAMFAISNPGLTEQLVLVAPQWVRETPSRLDTGGPLGAWRDIELAAMETRWLEAAPAAARDALIPPGGFELWLRHTEASDPGRSRPGTIRAVNGPIADERDSWGRGGALYDPGLIRAPVLLLHGEWDVDVTLDATRALFLAINGAPSKLWIEIGGATHMVLLERRRLDAFRSIAQFLLATA